MDHNSSIFRHPEAKVLCVRSTHVPYDTRDNFKWAAISLALNFVSQANVFIERTNALK